MSGRRQDDRGHGRCPMVHEIPVFSGRIVYQMRWWSVVICLVLFFFLPDDVSKILAALGFAAMLLLLGLTDKLLKKCTWQFYGSYIEKNSFGIQRRFYYEEITELLSCRKMRVTACCFKVPTGRGAIKFHYELVKEEQQKQFIEGYQFLKGKIQMELPELNWKVMDLMDRSYYYRKIRRRSGAFMLLGGLFTVVSWYALAGWGHLIAGPGVFGIAIGLALEYTQIKSLYEGIYFGKKNESRIQDIFMQYDTIKLRKTGITYFWLLAAVVLTVGVNLLCVMG